MPLSSSTTAALHAAGISYERLVALFRLIQARAGDASAAEILCFVQEDFSADKFAHLPAEQRARLQTSLRALQEYALEVWRAAAVQGAFPIAMTASGAFPAVGHPAGSGAYAVVPVGYAANHASGPIPTMPSNHASGPIPVMPVFSHHASGQFPLPALGASGMYAAVAPVKKGVLRRAWDAVRGAFSRAPQPQPFAQEITSALLAPGE